MFKSAKQYKRFLLVILFLSISLIFLFKHYRFNSIYDLNVLFINNDTDVFIKTNEKCDPFKSNPKYTKVLIDGIEYPKLFNLYSNKSIDFECLNKNKFVKTILNWNKYFAGDFFLGRVESFKKNGCPVWNCEVTYDKAKLDQSDLVFVNILDKFDKLPIYRPKNQRWIFGIFESPINTVIDLSVYNGFFNLSSSFRLDSDFPVYSYASQEFYWTKENKNFDENYDFTKGKEKLVFALITNCKAKSLRLDYIKELENHIKVDIYGYCGFKCPNEDCRSTLARKYKFILSFENSICKDYVTEKFFDSLAFNVVPVVLGGAQYDNYVPKSGYINALDFKTPRDLALYLIYLNKNATAYNSYFKWKKYIYYNNSILNFIYCDMCIKLHLESHTGIKETVINDLMKNYGRKGNCKAPYLNKKTNQLNINLKK